MHQAVNRRSRARSAAIQPTEAVLVLLVIMMLLLAVVLSSPRATQEMRTDTITVSAGDTLWSIAKSHPVPGMTTGETASLLTRMNDLERSDIRPGDALKVPVAASEGPSYAMR